PATPKPITVPPPKETFSAFGKLVRAASVVLAFASVAILIPIFPAKAEKTAPTTKAGTINQCVVGTAIEIPNNANEATTTNTESNLYSALKNAKAPSLMFFEISCIFSFPALCFFTHAILISINNNPSTDKAIGTIIKFDSIFNLFNLYYNKVFFFKSAKVYKNI